MFAIKFQPWAIKSLFQWDMSPLTDLVIPIQGSLLEQVYPIKLIAIGESPFEEKIAEIRAYLLSFLNHSINVPSGKKAVQLILNSKGEISLSSIRKKVGMSERSLERYFKAYIGLSPKFYSRVIRFAHIFSLAQEQQLNWTDITYLKGYYDQSHFIKNFKEFTGEEPSIYGFDKKNLANFFLSK